MSDLTTEPAEPTTCIGCGAVSPTEPPPPEWSRSIERGRTVWTCASCARENIRSIEGQLDSPWW